MMPILCQLSLFLALIKEAKTEFPALPVTTPYPSEQGFLRKIQPPSTLCYMQYGQPIEPLRFYSPSLFDDYLPQNKPACICERWYQPGYFMFSVSHPRQQAASEYTSCTEKYSSEQCDSFDGPSCEAKLWLGNPLTNPDTNVFKTTAILKCTADSSTAYDQAPKYLVSVESMDDFDVLYRCNADLLITMLNYKIEKYRANSQFYWQIPILNSTIDFKDVCDQKLFVEGAGLIIYYKCTNTIPTLSDESMHQKPEFFKTSATPPVHKPYWLRGGDGFWSELTYRGHPWGNPDFSFNQEEASMCVNENDGVMSPAYGEGCIADKDLYLYSCDKVAPKTNAKHEHFCTSPKLAIQTIFRFVMLQCNVGLPDYKTAPLYYTGQPSHSAKVEYIHIHHDRLAVQPGGHVRSGTVVLEDQQIQTLCDGKSYSDLASEINRKGMELNRRNTEFYRKVTFILKELLPSLCPNSEETIHSIVENWNQQGNQDQLQISFEIGCTDMLGVP